MNTVAEFKARLQQPGTQIRQIWNQREHVVDRILTVVKVQSNGFYCTSPGLQNRGWIPFPKRVEITFTENGWIRLENGEKLSEYEWVAPTLKNQS